MAILILVLSMTACKDSGFPVTVGGAEITEPPQTVAVISEQAASAICALGYKDYLVAAPSEFLTTKMEVISIIVYIVFLLWIMDATKEFHLMGIYSVNEP